MIKEAYKRGLVASMSDDPKIKASAAATYKDGLLAFYANALIHDGEPQKAVDLMKGRLEKNRFSGPYANTDAVVLSKAYRAQGLNKEAKEAVEKAVNNLGAGPGQNLKKILEELYAKDSTVLFETYFAGLQGNYKQELYVKYEKAMIKEVAPAFTLLDRAGKEVSLADYKGKVVVLDFWATWCGHCIVSFPGMQAAVNKYKPEFD